MPLPRSTLETFDALWTQVEDRGLVDIAPGATLRDGDGAHSLPSLPPLSAVAPGGDLVLGDTIGRGGMGQVHSARQGSLDREVAIKRLKPDAPPSAVRALVEEARHMGALEHPNIIPVHALGVDEQGRPALVMKRIEGVTWRVLIHEPEHDAWESGVWSDDLVERHVEVLLQVCRAVQFAHSRGVLHRDLKPDNVMVGPFGEVYVVDWGLARRIADEPGTWRLVGTPAYLAPEMARPDAAQGEATDIYLLGACLYEALTGDPPHPGDDLQAMLRHAHDGTLPPLPDDLPSDLADLLRTALASEPEDRFADVGALSQALTASLRHGAVRRMVRVADTRRLEAESSEAPEDALREAELGYRSAAAQWPESHGARQGLIAVHRKQVDLRLTRNDVEAAEDALARLRALNATEPALVDRVAEARRSWDALKARAAEVDPMVALRTRVRFFVAAQGLVAVGTLLQWPIVGDALARFTAGYLLALVLPFALLLVGAFAAMASKLWQPGVNRQVALFEAWCVSVVLVNRLGGWVADRDPYTVLQTDLLLTTLATAFAGLYIRRPFLRWAWLGGIGALVAVAAPWTAPYAFTVLALTSAGMAYTMNWEDWDTLA